LVLNYLLKFVWWSSGEIGKSLGCYFLKMHYAALASTSPLHLPSNITRSMPTERSAVVEWERIATKNGLELHAAIRVLKHDDTLRRVFTVRWQILYYFAEYISNCCTSCTVRRSDIPRVFHSGDRGYFCRCHFSTTTSVSSGFSCLFLFISSSPSLPYNVFRHDVGLLNLHYRMPRLLPGLGSVTVVLSGRHDVMIRWTWWNI
jgi:hypothetical protein